MPEESPEPAGWGTALRLHTSLLNTLRCLYQIPHWCQTVSAGDLLSFTQGLLEGN